MTTAGTLQFNDTEDDIVIAADGAVKSSKGGAAYSLHTTKTPGTLRSVLSVNGLHSQISSYQTEIFGILGAMLMLNRLLQKENRQWRWLSAVIWCNNEAAVNRFNKLEGSAHFSISGANHCNANVLRELRCVRAHLPIKSQAQWVKYHQAQCLTREARLNRVVDRLAATQHGKIGTWATRVSSNMLPHTVSQLHLRKGGTQVGSMAGSNMSY